MRRPVWSCFGWHPRMVWCYLDVATNARFDILRKMHYRAIWKHWNDTEPPPPDGWDRPDREELKP